MINEFPFSPYAPAPVGCLQYFTAETGDLRSFNFRPDVNANNDPNHLANLNYAICIRVANGYCGVKYTQVGEPIKGTVLSLSIKIENCCQMFSFLKIKKNIFYEKHFRTLFDDFFVLSFYLRR